MEKRFLGRRIVLTGATRGIGRATTRQLLEEGAQILGVARDAARLQKLEQELESLFPGQFHSCTADLEQEGSFAPIAEQARKLWGSVDVLINNAGVMLAHSPELTQEPEGILERTLQINLLAPFRLSRALLTLLRQGERPQIVHVSSGAGTHYGLTEPGIASYRLSKWSLNGLTLLQAKEFAGEIQILAFDPDWVKTDLGGPAAPGIPEDSAQALLKTLLLPAEHTGRLYKNAQIIDW